MALPGSEFPTYEELRAAGQRLTPSVDFLSLRWYFKGPIEKSIQVLIDPTDPDSDQVPYQTATTTISQEGKPVVSVQEHDIASSSLAEPPISSIRVTIMDLDDWEDMWVDAHRPLESDTAVFVDDGPDGLRKAIQCCGEERPYLHSPVPSCVVTASGESKPFVTIHDFIAAVHPWMTSLEDDIRRVKGIFRAAPLSKNVNMFVSPSSLSPLMIRSELGMSPASLYAVWKGYADLAARIRDGTLPAR